MASPKQDPLIGKLVGNYEVKALLGEGGMGKVYLAENPRIGRRVAIKVLGQQVAMDASFVDRFEAEARAITRIEHPSVIDIYDFGGLEDGRLYYVMELLKGRELREVLEAQGAMPAAEVLPYLVQICAALKAAHDQGVVHRDLKPENIFVLGQEPLQLKVLDFGIAKLLQAGEDSTATNTGVIMGTPRYISPEQAAGKPDKICTRTDLYSLGVILYQMLCGKVPFTASAPVLMLAMHLKEPPPPLRDRCATVPPAVAAIVHRCLEKEPEDRPASAREVAEAFAMAVDGDLEALHQARNISTSAISWEGGSKPGKGTLEDAATALDTSAMDATEASDAAIQDKVGPGTLTSTVGELSQEPPRALPSRLPLALGAILLLLVAGAVLFFVSREAPPPNTPPPPVAAAVPAAPPPPDLGLPTPDLPTPPDQAAASPDQRPARPKAPRRRPKKAAPAPKKKPTGPKKIGEGTLKIEL